MEMIKMLVPARRNMFNDFMMSPFDAFFEGPQGAAKANTGLMKTDIKETETEFQLTVDLPGVAKEDVTVQIHDGQLEIAAESHRSVEEGDGSWLRKERFEGKSSRTFYVGDEINEEAISAKFENGTLQITVPKRTKPEIEAKRTIAID